MNNIFRSLLTLTFLVIISSLMGSLIINNVYSNVTVLPYPDVAVRSNVYYFKDIGNENGELTLEIRNEPRFNIFVKAYGYKMYRNLSIENISNNTMYNVTLEPTYILYGYVKDPNGNPVVGALVRYSVYETYTDINGLYILYPDLPNSNYQLVVIPPVDPLRMYNDTRRNYKSNIYPVGGPYNLVEFREYVSPGNANKMYNVTLEYSGKIDGYIMFSNGTYAKNVGVKLVGESNSYTYTNDMGYYIVDSNLKPGLYTIYVDISGTSIKMGENINVSCVYPCMDPPDTNFTLPVLNEVTFQIVNSTVPETNSILYNVKSIDGDVSTRLSFRRTNTLNVILVAGKEYVIEWRSFSIKVNLGSTPVINDSIDLIEIANPAVYNRVMIRMQDNSNPEEKIRFVVEGWIDSMNAFRIYGYEFVNYDLPTQILLNGSLRLVNITVRPISYYYALDEPVTSLFVNNDMDSFLNISVTRVETIFINFKVYVNNNLSMLDKQYRLPIIFYVEGDTYRGMIESIQGYPHFNVGSPMGLDINGNNIFFEMTFPDGVNSKLKITLPNEVYRDITAAEHNGKPISILNINKNSTHTVMELDGEMNTKGSYQYRYLKIYAVNVIDEFDTFSIIYLPLIIAAVIYIIKRLTT